MTTANDIISTLSGKTKTLGWDAVVAYDRPRINHLLEQQYVSKLASGTHFSPVTWSNELNTIQFENMTLGAPLISFENASILSSRATAVLEFIDGNIAELNTDGQVTRYTRIRPGMGYGLELSIDLIRGEGSVDQEGKVVIDFSKASVSVVNGINEPPAEVVNYFSSWLLSNQVTYEVGQIDMEALGTDLTPTSFIIRTQPASDAAETGNGAVLLFVATNVNPAGGTLPTDTYPWLIPEEHSSAILVNNRIVLENYVKPTLDKMLETGSWALARGAGTDEAYYLQASDDATINSGKIRVYTDDPSYPDVTWSGNYYSTTEEPADFIHSLKGATLSLSGNTLKLSFDKNNTFQNQFAGKWWHCTSGVSGQTCAYYWARSNLSFELDGDVTYELNVNAAAESIQIAFKENDSVLTSNFESSFMYASSYQAGLVSSRLQQMLQLSSDILTAVPFNDINVFAVNHILFPEQNINTLQAAYAPGDMVIFGDIVSSLTSLVVEPLTTTLPVGGSVLFTSNANSSVTWSLSPAEAGSISSSGLYQAPAALDTRIMQVTVTATTADGAQASSHVTLVPSSVLVSPAFITVSESNLKNIQLNATVLGDNSLTGWTLEASESGLEGSITGDGLYTPPDVYPDNYPYGYTYVTATAAASDGGTAKAYIMLVNADTSAEFKVTPSLTSNLLIAGTQELTAKASLDFDPNSWSHYPQTGSLSTPVESSGTYSVTYTAPDAVSGDELVIVSTMQSGKAHRAGYALIDIANQEQDAWSRIEGVSTLKVTTESGGGSAQLYKNNAQQAAIVVQFSGYQLVNGIPREISVSMDDILPHLQLVDYVTGEALPRESGDGWFWTTQANEFERLTTGARLNDPQSRAADSLVLYVSCNSSAPESSKSIAVSVTLSDDTVISTASGATSGFNSSVTLTGLAAIDYSDPSSLKVVQGSLVTLSDSLSWAEHQVNSTTFTTREDTCQVKVDKFIFQPATDGVSRFHSFTFSYSRVMNYDVSSAFFSWDGNPAESTFRCLDDSQGQQRAVLGRTGEGIADGTVNIWFAGEQAALTEGQVYFASEEEDTLWRVEVPALSHDETSRNFPHLLLLKIVTKESESQPYRWSTVNNVVTLNMTDIFGNTGAVTVRWDEDDNYDIPHIA
ncbi:hypothetical protein [Enterobacter ludwigii]